MFPPAENRLILKEKILLPLVDLESTPFQKEFGVQESNRKSKKLSPLYKTEENLLSVFSPLKGKGNVERKYVCQDRTF